MISCKERRCVMSKKQKMKYVTREWYLYHHIDNENALIPTIVASTLAFFINPGVIWSVVVWMIYFTYCDLNNQKLNNSSEVLKEREWWKQSHITKGDWEECKHILGIE